MSNIEMTSKDIELLQQTVEFDLIRYDDKDDTERYKSSLALHMYKMKFWIGRNRFKTQEELTDFLYKYRDDFKSMAIPGNVAY